MAALLYGAGLRLTECLTLRIKDVDFTIDEIVVRGGKGGQDRITCLPDIAKSALERQVRFALRQHQEDLNNGAGWVEIPRSLARKYPHAGRSPGWQWVFPATGTYFHKETNQIRRHHFHETSLQRAVKSAVARAGIVKPASCHSLRHNADTCIMPTWPAFGKA
jgi:integrase